MKGEAKLTTGLFMALILAASPALARGAHAPARKACCRVPAGTLVEVALTDPITTATAKSGDSFALHLAAPLIVNGRILLRAGAPGVGEVIQSAKPGLGGKGAKLVLDARYLVVRGRHIPIDGLQLAGAGHDNSTAAQVLGLGGIGFAPLGFVGLAIQGGDVTFAADTRAQASIASAVVLPSLGRASRKAILAAAETTAPVAAGDIAIGPPPPGQGQVVFFRPKSLMGTGQWFNVREAGKPLGKLVNGAYFVQVATPGPHTYTAVDEPEFKDRLKLRVDPGQTYFVEGSLTKGLVLGVADLTPSNRARFEKVAGTLKPAPAPTADTTEQAANSASPPASEASADAKP
jgi:hypothetical protein